MEKKKTKLNISPKNKKRLSDIGNAILLVIIIVEYIILFFALYQLSYFIWPSGTLGP